MVGGDSLCRHSLGNTDPLVCRAGSAMLTAKGRRLDGRLGMESCLPSVLGGGERVWKMDERVAMPSVKTPGNKNLSWKMSVACVAADARVTRQQRWLLFPCELRLSVRRPPAPPLL